MYISKILKIQLALEFFVEIDYRTDFSECVSSAHKEEALPEYGYMGFR